MPTPSTRWLLPAWAIAMTLSLSACPALDLQSRQFPAASLRPSTSPPPSASPAPSASPEPSPSGAWVSADDFPSLQAAIDHLGATGGTVFLSPRRYDLSASLVVPGGLTLQGRKATDASGSVTTPTLRLADGADCDVIVNKRPFASSAPDVNIRLAGFAIDGNRPGQTKGRAGINLYHVKGVILEELIVRNCAGSGISLSHCQQGQIRNCTASDNGLTDAWATTGINLNLACFDVVVEGNRCDANNGKRIVTNGVPTTYDGNGIRIGDGCERNVIRGNTCSGNGRRGIKVQGSRNTIEDNVLRDNLGHSLALHGLEVTGNQVTGNQIRPYSEDGVWISGIYASGHDGPTHGNRIEGNTVESAQYGIEIAGGAAEHVIVSNTVTRSRGHGIYLRGSSENRVEGNTVTNSGQGGSGNGIQIIAEGGRSSARNRILGNTCTDTQATRTQAFGLKTDPGVDETTVTGNDFRGNKWAEGMSLSGSGNVVSGNQP